MPTYIFVALWVASFLLPTCVALGVATYGQPSSRVFVAGVGILLSITVNVGLSYYSYLTYPQWWSSGVLGLVYLPYIILNVIGVVVGGMGLAEQVDKYHAENPQPQSNVRRFRRSA